MNLFKRKKESGAEAEKGQESVGGRNPHYEDLLEKDFGLHFRGENQWMYEGESAGDYAAVLSDPELCLALLKKLKGALGFDHICVVPGSPSVFISCNRKPPLVLATSLTTDAVGDLISAILKEKPGAEVKEYQGTWMLPL